MCVSEGGVVLVSVMCVCLSEGGVVYWLVSCVCVAACEADRLSHHPPRPRTQHQRAGEGGRSAHHQHLLRIQHAAAGQWGSTGCGGGGGGPAEIPENKNKRQPGRTISIQLYDIDCWR